MCKIWDGVSGGTKMSGAICVGVVKEGSSVLSDSCCCGCGDGMWVEKGAGEGQHWGMSGEKWGNTKLGVGEVEIEEKGKMIW